MSIIEKALGKYREGQPVQPDGKRAGADRAANQPRAREVPRDASAEGWAEPRPVGPAEPITIDLPALRQRGIWPPASMERRLRDEFRRIKRPLLANATASGVAPVERGNLVVVASSSAGEGKTFIALNLALSMAQEVDFEVVLVDGDVARRTASTLLGLGDAPGLMDLLEDRELSAESVLVPTSIKSLSVLPAGRPHSLSVELLSSERMRQVSDSLAAGGRNRIVLFDSPPILAAPEALSLCATAGQIAMVVKAGSTLRHDVLTALDQLDPNKAINMILNKSLQVEHGDYYGAYYGYDGG